METKMYNEELKRLNKIGRIEDTISTGFYIYLLAKEKWKRGKYNGQKLSCLVSSLGRVYLPDKHRFSKLKEAKNEKYITVSIKTENKRRYSNASVGRLVLCTFNGDPPKEMIKPQADHIDNNPHNNSINNLRWLSEKDNCARRKGYTYNDDKIIKMIADELLKNELSQSEIAKKLNINPKLVCSVYNKHRHNDILKNMIFQIIIVK
jgi:hypothetical protein